MGRTMRALLMELVRRRRGPPIGGGGLHDKDALQHVHAAAEAEFTRTSCTPATVGANACDPLENRKYHSTQTMAARPTAVTTYCETLTPSRNTRCRGG